MPSMQEWSSRERERISGEKTGSQDIRLSDTAAMQCAIVSWHVRGAQAAGSSYGRESNDGVPESHGVGSDGEGLWGKP